MFRGTGMDYGLQISASGALANLHAQDTLTNNLANINTTGFKPLLAGTMFREAARIEDGLPQMSSNSLLERLGSGVLSAPATINFAQGELEPSTSEFDLAIEGEGFFLVGNQDNPALTRDGRFTLNSENQLVMAATGTPVLSDKGATIEIDPTLGILEVWSDGRIVQSGQGVGQIGIVDVPMREKLRPIGGGQYANQDGSALETVAGNGLIRQYMLEGSGANEIDALMKIQSVSRSAQSNIGMIDMQNRLISQAINTFGRIA
jgi:flagellar basal-body rod protein FlgF